MTETEFLGRLDTEIESWRREQVISADQAAAIRARYAAAEMRPRRTLARALAFLGATLIGVGVLVYVAANWEVIPGAVKLAIILGAMAAAYHGGYRLRYEGATYHGTGNALLFLGTLLFGGAIFLIAQGFQVNANVPSLLVLWAAGVIPMAYLLHSRPMLLLSALLLTLALGWEMAFWLPPDYQFSHFLLVYLFFGVLLYALGNLHAAYAPYREFRPPLGALGLTVIFSTLLPWTFPDFRDAQSSAGALALAGTGALWRLGLLVAISAATVALSALKYRGTPTARGESAVLAFLLLLGLSLFFAPLPLPAFAALLFNLLMLAGIAGAMAVGYYNREPAWIHIGLLFFTLLVACRYFDLLWSWMPRELFLIGAGALLLLGGIALERTRRHLIRGPQEETEEQEENDR